MMRRSLVGLAVSALCLVGSGLVTTPAATAASDNFPARIELPNGWRPEGITAGRGNSLYVGSLADGAIWQTDARTGAGSVLTPGTPGRVSVGLDFDKRNNRLWVAGGGTGEIRVVDVATGAILQTYAVPGLGGGVGFLNDVAVTREAVYVTNFRTSQIIIIDTPRNGELPAPSAVRTLALANGAVGNGIVESDGYLLIVQTSTGTPAVGKLWRVDPMTGAAIEVNLGGYSVLNGDGLELQDDVLYVVRNRSNLVAKFELSDDLLSGTLLEEITSPGNLDVPTTAALQGGRLWAVNARFGTPGPGTASYWITRLPK
jgi:sugar lactone lactonase YvrE